MASLLTKAFGSLVNRGVIIDRNVQKALGQPKTKKKVPISAAKKIVVPATPVDNVGKKDI